MKTKSDVNRNFGAGSARRNARATEVGFTLFELTATIVLSALLMLAAIPALSRLLNVYELRGAAQHLFGELQRVRVASISENNRYRVITTAGSDVYEVHDDDNNDNFENDGPDSVTTLTLADSPSVSFDSGTTLIFAPNGTVLSPGVITLVNRSGQARKVRVSEGGRIRIE